MKPSELKAWIEKTRDSADPDMVALGEVCISITTGDQGMKPSERIQELAELDMQKQKEILKNEGHELLPEHRVIANILSRQNAIVQYLDEQSLEEKK